jgi:hypothetical protein
MATSESSGHLRVDSLFRNIPPQREARWSLLKDFFAAWYGPLEPADGCPSQSISAAEQRLQTPLPAALREWYALAGRRRSVWPRQDHFLEPEQLRIARDKLVICVENQGVVQWAIPLDCLSRDDPPVLVSDQCDSNQWIEETSNISLFALAQMVVDVKFSDSTTFSADGQATDASLAAISRSYRRLDFPDLNWPPHPTRLYGGPDLIIQTNAETWIWISSKSPTSFQAAIRLLSGSGVVWEQIRGLEPGSWE